MVLFPTLVAMCNGNSVNTEILSKTLNPKSLAGFIRTHIYNSSSSTTDEANKFHASRIATLATTCAVLMSAEDWQAAEEFFETFQQPK